MSANLTLALKRRWFDDIKSGTKTEEYRIANEYWSKRIIDRSYDTVTFTLGYPKRDDHSRRVIRRYLGYEIKTMIHDEFGPDPVNVFALQFEDKTP